MFDSHLLLSAVQFQNLFLFHSNKLINQVLGKFVVEMIQNGGFIQDGLESTSHQNIVMDDYLKRLQKGVENYSLILNLLLSL
jgi:hypothetical protein